MTTIHTILKTMFARHPNGKLEQQSPRLLRDIGINPADVRRKRWDTPSYWVEP